MQNPTQKNTGLYIFWGILFCFGLILLKAAPLLNISPRPHWINQTLSQKLHDTAIKKLNMNMPSQDMYRTLMDPSSSAPQEFWNKMIDYYSLVSQAMPQLSESHAMLGICYDRMGQSQKAVEEFEQAQRLLPSFFYHHYNLGIAYIKTGKTSDGIKHLFTALQSAPQATAMYVSTSKIYGDILGANPSFSFAYALQSHYVQLMALLKILQSNPMELESMPLTTTVL